VALAIGHPHPTTIAALAKFLPELERADIELVAPSQIVRQPELARLHPPPPPHRKKYSRGGAVAARVFCHLGGGKRA